MPRGCTHAGGFTDQLAPTTGRTALRALAGSVSTFVWAPRHEERGGPMLSDGSYAL
jgi:hypothetical protein